MSALQIRNAVDDDRDAIREITLAAYQQYAALMPGLWERYRQGILDALADTKPVERIVAQKDGRVVGSVMLYPAGTTFSTREETIFTLECPEMRLLAVPPEVRGQGVAVTLVRECIHRAQQSGAKSMTLHTTDLMVVAKGMYERMGFVRAPELDFHPTPEFTVKGYRLMMDER
jgi:predicted N-acetyltransferase YhbS